LIVLNVLEEYGVIEKKALSRAFLTNLSRHHRLFHSWINHAEKQSRHNLTYFVITHHSNFPQMKMPRRKGESTMAV